MIYKHLTIAVILITNVSLAFSQVTIGNNEPPAEGALLQLKNINSITNGGVNSTKGLMLPRVELKNKFTLDPIDSETDKEKYTGLWVYNVTDKALEPIDACEAIPDWNNFIEKGIQVWNGEQWISLGSDVDDTNMSPPGWTSPDVKYLDDKDGNRYPVKKFGNAGVWMLENLRVTSPVNYTYTIDIYGCCDALASSKSLYRYSFPSPPNSDGTYPLGTDDTFFKKYPNIGLRYSPKLATNDERPTFDSAGNIITTIQGICPNGWHLPSLTEFNLLISEISRLGNAGDYDNAGTIQSQMNGVSPDRWGATQCVPESPLVDYRGASQLPYKGGLAILWAGANSPTGSTLVQNGSKEYGTLAVYWLINEGKYTTNPDPNEYPYRNIYVRPTYTQWKTDAQNKINTNIQYSVRCMKDNTDMSDLK